jgi:hypothetical protein
MLHNYNINQKTIQCLIIGIMFTSALANLNAQSWSSVTSISTTDVNTGNSTTRSGLTATVNGGSGVTPDTVIYNGIERQISAFVAGGQYYIPTASGVAYARRNGAAEVFPNENLNGTSAWNEIVSGSGTTTHTISGQYINTMDALFTSRNIMSGTENLFVNLSVADSNAVNSVERMDFVFTNGLTVISTQGFAVFERGLGVGGNGSNGGFKVAAITSIDSSGTPTGIGNTVVSIGNGAYNNGGVGVGITPVSYNVLTYAASGGPELDRLSNYNLGPQGIAGAFILTTALANPGDTIYGYVVFGSDVTATGNNLLDVTNTSIFDPLSGSSNDMDMVASGASLYTVPEPGSAMCLLTAGAVFGLFSRRRRD